MHAVVRYAVPQLCFDFIESSADGQLYSIECNPRTSTVITQFHDNPELATGTATAGIAAAVSPAVLLMHRSLIAGSMSVASSTSRCAAQQLAELC